jgi:hypothetical protein
MLSSGFLQEHMVGSIVMQHSRWQGLKAAA